MKIIFDKDELIGKLTPAMGAVSDNNTISVIEGILFTTDGPDRCVISSYDLEKGYRTQIDAQVLEEGSYIINAQKLYRMIRMMPDRSVTIEVDEKFRTKISSGASRYALSALPGADFPNLPDLNGEGRVGMKQSTLKKIIGQVQHAMAQGSQRPMLCGAFFKLSGSGFTVVTCDGNRLALRERSSDYSIDDGAEYSFIVPGKTLVELYKILKNDGDEEVEISFGRKHVIFRMGESIFFSRLIDGEYLNYKRLIPRDNKIKVVLDRKDLIACLERVQLVTDDRSVGQLLGSVKCVFQGDELRVSSSNSISSVNDEMEIEKEGRDITIGFNCRFLLDALHAISDDRIRLMMGTEQTGILIERDPDAEAGEPVEEPAEEPAADTEDEAPAEETKEKKSEKKEDEGNYLYLICPTKLRD